MNTYIVTMNMPDALEDWVVIADSYLSAIDAARDQIEALRGYALPFTPQAVNVRKQTN